MAQGQLNDLLNYAQFINSKSMSRARKYVREGRVVTCRYDPQSGITGKVQGTQSSPYSVQLRVCDGVFEGSCTCPVSFACKHIGAVLLACQANQERQSVEERSNPKWQRWVEGFAAEELDERSAPAHRLVYIVSPLSQKLRVSLNVSRVLKSGGLGQPKGFSLTSSQSLSALQPDDMSLIPPLVRASSPNHLHWIELEKSDVLLQIVATGRAYWEEVNPERVLRVGEEKEAELAWVMDRGGRQQLGLANTKKNVSLLSLSPPCYFDKDSHTIGPFVSSYSPQVLKQLLACPTVEPDEAIRAQAELERLAKSLEVVIPVPKVPKVEKLVGILPTPKLSLHGSDERRRNWYGEELLGAYAKVSFLYGEHEVPFAEENETVYFQKEGEHFALRRQLIKETERIQELRNTHLVEIPRHGRASSFLLSASFSGSECLLNSLLELKKLEKQGWLVVVDQSFPTHLAEPEEEWWCELDEQEAAVDWFKLELGVTVDGKRVNVVPMIVKLLRNQLSHLSPEELLKIDDNLLFLGQLPDGQWLPLPFSKIKPILRVLIELCGKGDEGMTLHRTQASDLLHLQNALQLSISEADSKRWQQLRTLGERLRSFQKAKNVRVPDWFEATLRPYQQNGLNWLQFLRGVSLGGILADDMGLGKTVQTLAHIAVEKEKGRLKGPALVVTPTSVASNWQKEAEAFSSRLKTVKLQGDDRKQRFDQIASADVVLTTYPLLSRDRKFLTSQEYEMVIFDEAQFLKNPRTKAYHAAKDLNTRHRIALSGTPVENNLGELWALCHLVNPGMLGSSREFQSVFRRPIEVRGDTDRQEALRRRIAPFLLRREKNQVLNDLPQKTEIIHSVALGEKQSRVYEAVRLMTEKQVRGAVASMGFDRSHLMILDALLKLRQICCAPSLLKLESIDTDIESAKFNYLFDLLSTLLEEGRRILLFSSFTSMLGLIENRLKHDKIAYTKLTGSTKYRQKPIDRFQNGEVPLFLISLKAGGTGLNLTAADTVIHYDPWWNPAAEDQASSRAHRMGQEKPVFVHKLVTEKTVEEKILEMQKKKRQLAESIYSKKKGGHVGKFTKEDLEHLFAPLSRLTA
jgi:superfamily II DNA or RNA helicase